MIKWLRKKLRKWLIEEEDDDYLDYRCRVGAEMKVMRGAATGAMGTCLRVCSIDPSVGERIIGSGEALNQKRFWRLWKRFQGNATIEWEDGTPFEVED
jgi:hypothetical protein